MGRLCSLPSSLGLDHKYVSHLLWVLSGLYSSIGCVCVGHPWGGGGGIMPASWPFGDWGGSLYP